MADKTVQWTQQQSQAIRARGRDVLVTASAGTGKTAVLSGRCVEIVADPGICPDVGAILVLTFTDMAAEEMRSRIAALLRQRARQTGNAHLARQVVLLQGADISTIHSFCKRLITEFFHEIDLDPTFAVLDADEVRLLKAETLERTIEWAWTQEDLAGPLRRLLTGRTLAGPNGFLSQIVEISDLLDTVIDRQGWRRRAVDAVSAEPLEGSLAGEHLRMVAEHVREILDRSRHAATLCRGHEQATKWLDAWEQPFIAPLAAALALLEKGRFDAFLEALAVIEKPRTNKPKGLDGPVASIIDELSQKVKKRFDALRDLAILNPDYIGQIRGAVCEQTQVLVELVRQFDAFYQQTKRSLNGLDFADLEHHALRLLCEDPAAEELKCSTTALAMRDRYRAIFVDEYQDINPVQKAILRMLAAGDNVFFVGDVKQSIYAFRGAEPDIFVSDLRSAAVHDAEGTALRVDLNTNFRSRREILDFVNHVFNRTMTEGVSSIDYGHSAFLSPPEDKGEPQEPSEPIVELHVLDETAAAEDSAGHDDDEAADSGPTDTASGRRRQALMIAERIRRMVGAESGSAEFQVFDRAQGRLRDVEYRDIVVLMRSLANKANEYVEVLRLAGVPVAADAAAGYFEATEITDMISLLKVLDNPRRDIELAAVLRSPLFGVADDELARVRLFGLEAAGIGVGAAGRLEFYDAVRLYAEKGPESGLTEKLAAHLAQLDRWRTQARRGSIADLIASIYRQTRYPAFVTALPNGQGRRANLLKLHDRAIQFEGFVAAGSLPSLGRFVEFIEKLRESGGDWAPAEPEAVTGNAVRILSVHKSKGLEFPVVFLAELETEFNLRDIRGDCLADARLGLGLRVIDEQTNLKVPSPEHQMIAERRGRRGLAEEMRILYVATTRARERLVLTASQKNAGITAALCNGLPAGGRIPDWQLRSCKNALEWLVYGLSDQRVMHEAFATGLEAEAREDRLVSVRRYDADALAALTSRIEGLGRVFPSARCGRTDIRGDMAIVEAVKKSLYRPYRFADAPRLPAKQSVSELTHAADEFASFDYSGALSRHPTCLIEAADHHPSSRLFGTATHLLIAKLDLSAPVTPQSIGVTLDKLVGEAAIARPVAERIDIGAIHAFFTSPTGRSALEPANRVHREWSFTCVLNPSLWAELTRATPAGAGHTGDGIIVQGIIDMLIETPEGLVVVDFKTDTVGPGGIEARAAAYRTQLLLYAQAAEGILRRPVVARWLHFLHCQRSVALG